MLPRFCSFYLSSPCAIQGKSDPISSRGSTNPSGIALLNLEIHDRDKAVSPNAFERKILDCYKTECTLVTERASLEPINDQAQTPLQEHRSLVRYNPFRWNNFRMHSVTLLSGLWA